WIAGALALAACGDNEGRPTTSTSVTGFPTTTISGGETSDSMSGDGDGDDTDTDTNSTGPLLDVGVPGDGDGDGDPEECAAVSEQAQNQFAPVDIIFAIDTSGSMTEEKNFVQQNMNMFSQQI